MERLSEAKRILEDNWRDGFTVPNPRLYPFQWMWDSGFVAMGRATYNVKGAMQEIDKMFEGQWPNGMLPHILFHSEKETTYFPNYDFWQSDVNSGAPRFPKSSGITQPAVYGFVLCDILKNNWGSEEVKSFAKRLYTQIVDYHRYLYRHRDPRGEGLMYMYHPWESGRDNSPLWDEALYSIEISEGSIPPYERKDTQIASADERPTQDKYDRYVYLLELGKRHGYDGTGIAEESPFLIQDTMMNAILIRSNECLIEIASDLGLDANEVKEWQKVSLSNFEQKLWDEDMGIYVAYDLRNEKQIRQREIGGYTPLLAGISTEYRAKRLAHYLEDLSSRGYYLCPSFDVDSPLFDSKRYWRGPIWPQMNWLIYQGLKRYGYDEVAEKVKGDFLTLVHSLGFYEYFESQKHLLPSLDHGYGGGGFSWTASTYIHFLNAQE